MTTPAKTHTITPAWKISTDGRTYRHGKITVADHSTVGLTPEQRRELADAVRELQSAYPVPRSTVHVSVEPNTHPDFATDDDDRVTDEDPNAFVAGSTNTKTRRIVINERNWTVSDAGNIGMPVADTSIPWVYTLVHEWSHAADPDLGGFMEMIIWRSAGRHLSWYGRMSPQEGYAEAHTEWILTHGQTTNESARTYADAYGWTTDAPALPTPAHTSQDH